MTRLPIRCIPFDLRSALAAAVLCTTAYASGACLADDSTPPASTDAASAAVAWPQFRGAEAKGLSSAPAPTSWDLETGKNVLWRIDVPGLGHSAPIVWGDRVFLTTAVREQGDQSLKPGLYGDIDPVTDEGVHRWLVIAYDRASGEELWRREAHRGVPAIQRHTKATHANSTPATDGQRVVAFLGSEGLHAYDLDGEELWSVDFGVLDSGYFAAPEAQWGFGSSPVLHDGKVIIQVDVQENSFLAALDADTGEVIWRTPRRDVPTWSSPTVIDDGDGGLQVVINGYKRLGGYSFATGEPLWWMPGGGDIPVPTPFEHQGRIVFSSSHGLSSPIFVVDQAARGDVSLSGGASSNEAIPWAHFRGGAYMPTPIALDGRIFLLRDNGILVAYDIESGEKIWEERLAKGRSAFTASPIAAGGRLYLAAESGDVHVVEAGDRFERLAINPLDAVVLSTPAAAGGQLFFRTQGELIAIGASSAVEATGASRRSSQKEPTHAGRP